MAKTYVCAFLDYAHRDDVEVLKGNVIVLRAGKNWTRLVSKSKITYQTATETPDAGPVKKETVTVTADSTEVEPLTNPKEYYILRLHIDGKEVIVGSLDFPAKKIINDDKVRASVTFTRTSTL